MWEILFSKPRSPGLVAIKTSIPNPHCVTLWLNVILPTLACIWLTTELNQRAQVRASIFQQAKFSLGKALNNSKDSMDCNSIGNVLGTNSIISFSGWLVEIGYDFYA